ncbi:SDR family NAD(P)-dependent oxidoreductase [Kitasatospora griseola]|uniref:SDR family NAD(P)-dependent oxidoreductase n=1 Tax=Kitasatospora griseola TaxID=2064 RepID=UPI0037F4A1DE
MTIRLFDRRQDPRGRRVLITGASGAIGRPLGERLTRAGAHVVGLDLRPTGDAPFTVLRCDITDDSSIATAVAEAPDTLGGLDILANNAGIGGPAPADLATSDEVRRQLEINLLGTWRTTAARGRVVMVTSRMAVMQLPLAAAYGASKRAMVAYAYAYADADALSLELGTHVTVSCVHPSAVRSPIHDSTKAAGLSLDGMSVYEPLDGVLDTIERAALAVRARRDLPTTRKGTVEFFLARHLPALTGRIVRRTLAERAAAGAFDDAPLAAGVAARHRSTP